MYDVDLQNLRTCWLRGTTSAFTASIEEQCDRQKHQTGSTNVSVHKNVTSTSESDALQSDALFPSGLEGTPLHSVEGPEVLASTAYTTLSKRRSYTPMTGIDVLGCFQGNRKCICQTGTLLSNTHVMTMNKRKWTALVKICCRTKQAIESRGNSAEGPESTSFSQYSWEKQETRLLG